MKIREENGKKVSDFVGWRLIPEFSKGPSLIPKINPDIPASSRGYPKPWEHTSMYPDNGIGVVKIPGTNSFASDGSSDSKVSL